MADISMSGIDRAFERRMNLIKERLEPQIKAELKKAAIEFIPIAEADLKTLFKDAVDNFYTSYNPKYYQRNKSLYDIFVITRDTNGMGFDMEFDPAKMTGFRNGYKGEDGLYQQVFIKGWHGGAGSGPGHPNPGVPYWRTPLNIWTRWGKEASISSPSPYEHFEQKKEEYQRGEAIRKYLAIRNAHLANIKYN